MTETQELFATAATADQIDAGIGVIWWATHPPGGYALTVLDYDIFDVLAVNAQWVGTLFERSAALIAKHRPAKRECLLHLEHTGLIEVLRRAEDAYDAADATDRSMFGIKPIEERERAKWPATLDERIFSIRPIVDSGKVVKLETGLRRFSFRAIRTNHLIAQIRQHRPGDAGSAGELLHAFVLGVLLGTKPKTGCFFDVMSRLDEAPGTKSDSSSDPFGVFIPGRRPL